MVILFLNIWKMRLNFRSSRGQKLWDLCSWEKRWGRSSPTLPLFERWDLIRVERWRQAGRADTIFCPLAKMLLPIRSVP